MSAVPLSARLPAAVWQADQLAIPPLPVCPSGFDALDAELPGGGWPASGLTELLLAQPGCGEIQLLARTIQARAVWVAPPCLPHAPALHALGIVPEQTLCILSNTAADAAWAAEQALRSGNAGTVLWWTRSPTSAATLRRLHLTALDHTTPLFALRPSSARAQSSPAPLRLALAPAHGARLRVDLFKRRGPSLAQPLLLSVPQPALRERPPCAPPVVTEDVVVSHRPTLATA